MNRSGLKGFAAAAALFGVRIGDFKTTARQSVAEIDLRAAKILGTESIYQYCHPALISDDVAITLLVEDHAILHAGAAALLHIHAELFSRVVRLRQQVFYLLCRTVSQTDKVLGWCRGIHLVPIKANSHRHSVKWRSKSFFPSRTQLILRDADLYFHGLRRKQLEPEHVPIKLNRLPPFVQ